MIAVRAFRLPYLLTVRIQAHGALVPHYRGSRGCRGNCGQIHRAYRLGRGPRSHGLIASGRSTGTINVRR